MAEVLVRLQVEWQNLFQPLHTLLLYLFGRFYAKWIWVGWEPPRPWYNLLYINTDRLKLGWRVALEKKVQWNERNYLQVLGYLPDIKHISAKCIDQLHGFCVIHLNMISTLYVSYLYQGWCNLDVYYFILHERRNTAIHVILSMWCNTYTRLN